MANQFGAAGRPRQLAEHAAQFASRNLKAEERNNANQDSDEDEDEDSFEMEPADRIRRSYHLTGGQQHRSRGRVTSAAWQPGAVGANTTAAGETIQVTLDEGYFARERRFLVGQLANARQRLNSLQLFNPAKNETLRQKQQQEWSEKEKYTLDSLNELNGTLGERFAWNKPDDGRRVWPSKLQYLLAITSYSIGLGNVIRFPILVQKNGGLAFIIPFVIMLLLEGIPLFYLELAIGQRTRKAAISCWNLVSPFAVGIGLASAAVSFLIGLYYNTMVAWTLLYTWAALTNKLPARVVGSACAPAVITNAPPASWTAPANNSIDTPTSETECQLATPFEHFWFRDMLDISAGVSDWAHFNWAVALCLVLAWLISYLCLVRGLSSSKQLVYVVSTFPYVILLIFLAKAYSLRGMEEGLKYLLEPDWPKLFDPYVWLQAAAQVFFSLGLGFGGLIALSSYNQVNNNCYKDAIKVSIINFATSLLAGVVVFSILGFRATLNFDKCQIERTQQIDFYLADYNLKVLEYGAVFKQVHANKNQQQQRNSDNIEQFMATKQQKNGSGQDDDNEATPGTVNSSNEQKDLNEIKDGESDDDEPGMQSGSKQGDNASNNNDIDSSLDDAIDSITNLDRQLDLGAPSGSFDYGDSDTAFILNASNLIEPKKLDKVIENIENLPKCSIRAELSHSTRGTGLVFVVMAEAISQFESNPNYWLILFFLMILSLGFDSQFGNLEGLLSSLTDFNFNMTRYQEAKEGGHPHSVAAAAEAVRSPTATITIRNGYAEAGYEETDHENGHSTMAGANSAAAKQRQKSETNQQIRKWATGCICCLSLIVSLIVFTRGNGSYMFAIFDEYASSFSLVVIALFELLAISYIYGLKRFCDDCELMTGRRPPFIVLLSWRYISPILLLFLLLTTIKQFASELNYETWSVFQNSTITTTSSSNNQFDDFLDITTRESSHFKLEAWPNWSILFGAVLVVGCIIWIPLIAVLRVMRINLIADEQQQRWFPAEELREFHQLQDREHQVTKMERILFGFNQDDD